MAVGESFKLTSFDKALQILTTFIIIQRNINTAEDE